VVQENAKRVSDTPSHLIAVPKVQVYGCVVGCVLLVVYMANLRISVQMTKGTNGSAVPPDVAKHIQIQVKDASLDSGIVGG
jgi:hypothetical protein